MKKSEALDKILTRCYQLIEEIEKRPDIEIEIKEQFAEIILDDLEKLGMLPPPIIKQSNKPSMDGETNTIHYLWEPEENNDNYCGAV